MMVDLVDRVQIARCIDALTQTGNAVITGLTVDLQNLRSAMFAISIGAMATANSTFAVTLNESSDNSTWTAVAAADMIGTLALASWVQAEGGTATAKRKLGYVGKMRYLQLIVTPTGNTGAAQLSALAILGAPALQPRTAQN